MHRRGFEYAGDQGIPSGQRLRDLSRDFDTYLDINQQLSDDAIPWDKGTAAMSELESKIPALAPEVLKEFGLPVLDGKVDEERAAAFRKEGKTGAGTTFRVVTSSSGKTYLLKRNHLWLEDPNGERDKLHKLSQLREMSLAEAASDVASLVNYPMSRTRLVLFEGVPCVASEYIDDVVESTEPEARNRPLINPDAERLRPYFNALLLAEGDASWQGLVDANGKYYAHDTQLIADSDLNSSSLDEVTRMLVSALNTTKEKDIIAEEEGILAAYPYGRPEPNTLRDDLAKLGFLERLQSLAKADLSPLFENYYGSQREKDLSVHGLQTRAKVLIAMLSS